MAASQICFVVPDGALSFVAQAGPDQTVSATLPVSLDGSGSTDADGDAITYAWSIASAPAGSAAALDDATSATPTFTPDVPGTYAVEAARYRDGKRRVVELGSIEIERDTRRDVTVEW